MLDIWSKEGDLQRRDRGGMKGERIKDTACTYETMQSMTRK